MDIAIWECAPQIMAVLKAIPKNVPVGFAYEHVWAIGVEQPKGANHVIAVTRGLRELLGNRREVKILYRKSAEPEP